MMARFCILLLGFLVLQASSKPDPRGINISTQDSTNITTKSPEEYQRILFLLPANETSDQKPSMVVLLSEIMASNDSDPVHNEVARPGEDDGKTSVLLITSLQTTNGNDTSANLSLLNNTSTLQHGAQKLMLGNDFIRKRRSPEQADALVRKKRTYNMPCMVCGMPAMVMSMIKKHKKKKHPQYQQAPPCGHPMSSCGQPQHPQQPYYPPPQHPAPQYYPPQQQHQPNTCNQCQQGSHPGYGSYSQSSSSSQSSSNSWGKK